MSPKETQRLGGVNLTTAILSSVGEMAEWLKAHAWKACMAAMLSQVRILFSPPN